MFINITDKKQADNKASSSGLVHYLEKENRIHNKEPEYWFNGSENNIEPYEVRRKIDSNIAKLGRDDAKFFLINISPSQKEIAFLKQQYREDAKAQMKAFAVHIMDVYAQNFKRTGIESHHDLIWFGKLENYRYYGHNDPEVKQGLKKKEGIVNLVTRCICRLLSAGRMPPIKSSSVPRTHHAERMPCTQRKWASLTV